MRDQKPKIIILKNLQNIYQNLVYEEEKLTKSAKKRRASLTVLILGRILLELLVTLGRFKFRKVSFEQQVEDSSCNY